MKKILILLLISSSAFAGLEYDQIETHPDFEVKFLLSSQNNHQNKVVLDCQSFLHKLEFYDASDSLYAEKFIDIYQCEEIYLNVMNCFDRGEVKCIDENDILNPNCTCN